MRSKRLCSLSPFLEGYAFLKIAGKGEGLNSLRKMLSARFDRSATKAASTPVQEI